MKKCHFKLRDYQEQISDKAWRILLSHKIVYLSMQVRTGKTLTALATINKLINTKPQDIYNVLFLTKKKAIQSIVDDYNKLGCKFKMETMNYEQLHNYNQPDVLDFVIADEPQCIVGNSSIDGLKIKDIKIGDSLKSYNFDKNIIEKKKVVNVIKHKAPSRLIKIKANGKEIVCTEDHEIYTNEGWKEARFITNKDKVFIK